MKRKTEFLSLAEELQSYILSVLPWRDILHCTSVSYNLLIDVDVTVVLDLHILSLRIPVFSSTIHAQLVSAGTEFCISL